MNRNEARDELLRCKEIIGWSWQGLGDQLGLTPAQVFSVKASHRDVPPSDVAWVQAVAAAVEGVPSRAEFARVDEAARAELALVDRSAARIADVGAGISSDWSPPALLSAAAVPDPSSSERMEIADMTAAQVCEALAAVYWEASTSGRLDSNQRLAARWTIGEVAGRLGLVDEVKAALLAPEAPAEAVR